MGSLARTASHEGWRCEKEGMVTGAPCGAHIGGSAFATAELTRFLQQFVAFRCLPCAPFFAADGQPRATSAVPPTAPAVTPAAASRATPGVVVRAQRLHGSAERAVAFIPGSGLGLGLLGRNLWGLSHGCFESVRQRRGQLVHTRAALSGALSSASSTSACQLQQGGG